MKKLVITAKQNTKIIVAGLLAFVVGAGAVGLATAAIPSSVDGKIYGCYSNNAGLFTPKGNLRVIDNSNTNCSAGETAINWPSIANSSGPRAYGHVTASQGGGTSTASFDHSHAVLDVQYNTAQQVVCIKLDSTAQNLQNVQMTPVGGLYTVNLDGVDSTVSGTECPTGYTIGVHGDNPLNFYFSAF